MSHTSPATASRTMGGSWTRRLRPVQQDGPEPMCHPRLLELALKRVGPQPVAWAVEVGLDLARRCTDLIPYLGGGEQAVRAMRPTTESLAISMLLALDAGEHPAADLIPGADRDILALIHRRVPIERVWSAQREGHAQLAEHYLSACRHLVPESEQAGQMESVSRILFEVANSFAERSSEVFLVEERRWLARAAAARDDLVRAVLARKDVDAAAASRELGYDLTDSYHVGLILRQDDSEVVDTVWLPRATSSLLRSAGAVAQIVMPADHGEVWAWAAFRKRPDTRPFPAVDLPHALVAVGRVRRGIEGFRSTHDEARAAARLVGLDSTRDSGGRMVYYDDVSLMTLLSVDGDRAVSFMRDELGALYQQGEALRVLRETVRAYLECNCSPQHASRRLTVAKNTVVYRVSRAEELLGREVKSRQLELWAALSLAEIIEP
ncbi:helix-turn-helix domain-containing protein [Streptomyces sp. NPDC005799]|uniref:PucR family transcriptional regulator n=1 Tax=Streptomyces sp. NPDC005799 TaxID=3154678 RepID=UPI0033E88E61